MFLFYLFSPDSAMSMLSIKEEKKRRKIPGKCDICGKEFKSTTNIAAHRKLHTEEKKFECPECNKKFRRKLHLERHMNSHAGIKSFTCEICGAQFSSKWYVKNTLRGKWHLYCWVLVYSTRRPFHIQFTYKGSSLWTLLGIINVFFRYLTSEAFGLPTSLNIYQIYFVSFHNPFSIRLAVNLLV